MKPCTPCPLCSNPATTPHAVVATRRYWHCDGCGLVSIDPGDLPGRDEEDRLYRLHENAPGDPGYRRFLDQLATPLCARLHAGATGLDYGAGPGPTLALMLGERGFPTLSWDPVFEPHDRFLQQRYDFVTCTEVVEHFHRPAEDFARLASLVRPGGWLAIMTRWRRRDIPFDQWQYARDPTHASFYDERTFDWIARTHGFELEKPARNIALMRATAPGVDGA